MKVILYNLSRMMSLFSFLILIEEFYRAILSVSVVALSVIIFSFEIFTFLAFRSERIFCFLLKVEGYRITGIIRKYGIMGLFPGIIVAGFYICPAIAFVFGMKKDLAVISMMAGYYTASLFTLFIAKGLSILFLS